MDRRLDGSENGPADSRTSELIYERTDGRTDSQIGIAGERTDGRISRRSEMRRCDKREMEARKKDPIPVYRPFFMSKKFESLVFSLSRMTIATL